jgi:AraC-like DNA-binding protein
MDLTCEERPSDSPLVAAIWRNQTEQAGSFISMAQTMWGMVITRHNGTTTLTVRGPETRATPAYAPAGAEFFGIYFKAGAFMPTLPARMVMDRRDLNLPEAASKSFWLNGRAWQFPDFENADTFVDWLVRDGLLVHDPVVDAAAQRQPVNTSSRTVQRRFLQATGLTQTAHYQIERARYATSLLKQGVSILDTVYQAGYFDQPHLTRSLKRLIGQTPAQIIDTNRTERLSLLYKTSAALLNYDSDVRQYTSRLRSSVDERSSYRLYP